VMMKKAVRRRSLLAGVGMGSFYQNEPIS